MAGPLGDEYFRRIAVSIDDRRRQFGRARASAGRTPPEMGLMMMAMEGKRARYFRTRRKALASTASTSSTTSDEIRWTPNRDVTRSPSLTTYS